MGPKQIKHGRWTDLGPLYQSATGECCIAIVFVSRMDVADQKGENHPVVDVVELMPASSGIKLRHFDNNVEHESLHDFRSVIL